MVIAGIGRRCEVETREEVRGLEEYSPFFLA